MNSPFTFRVGGAFPIQNAKDGNNNSIEIIINDLFITNSFPQLQWLSPDNACLLVYRYDFCMSTDNEDLQHTKADICKHITKLRKAKGLSMYQLSLDSGISNSVLMRIEKGEREPKLPQRYNKFHS